MPLYIADYLADTSHLDAAESGAYLHLIMHYWQKGCLPNDEQLLCRIARMRPEQWTAARPIISEFFHDGWKHTRIEEELAKSAEVSERRSANAKLRWSKGNANALQEDSKHSANSMHHAHVPQPQSQKSSSSDSKGSSEAPPVEKSLPAEKTPEARVYARGKEILGQSAGGLVKKLLVAKNNSIPQAMAALEMAAGVAEPREYLGAIIRGREQKSKQDLRLAGEAW